MAQLNTSDGSTNITSSASPITRQAPSPTSSLAMSTNNSVNGSVAGAGVMSNPLSMGHQQDLNFLYRQMQELGEILRSNRDKVNGITLAAEEVMVRLVPRMSEGALSLMLIAV